MEQEYVIHLTIVIAVIALFGIITMQLLLAVFAIAFVIAILVMVRFYQVILGIQQSVSRIEQRLDAMEKQ